MVYRSLPLYIRDSRCPLFKVAEDRCWVFVFPTLHKYVEQSRVMESPLPGGKPKPSPLSLDSLL
jgi:hypothetical protein